MIALPSVPARSLPRLYARVTLRMPVPPRPFTPRAPSLRSILPPEMHPVLTDTLFLTAGLAGFLLAAAAVALAERV